MADRLPELLAPAGGPEALLAALRCGADAVYVGASDFSARQSAENFDAAALREACRLCHLYGAKLYLAANTLVFDNQFSRLDRLTREAADAGVDAFIMQDPGAIAFVGQICPTMPIHASTQMTVHTVQGALEAARLGIRRVVAARELSCRELEALCGTGLEIEVFCHGALCMSVSGQCYLSAMVGSRSANRGRCAQACRLPFTACGDAGACALSLKDLCSVSRIPELVGMGVASLKIEGRMKRPEYVAAAVTAYRQALAGQPVDLEQLRAVFSRSGFTDGYLTGKRQRMFGVRSREDVTAAKQVLPGLQSLYAKPGKQASLTAEMELHAQQPARLTLTDEAGHTATVQGDIPEPAQHVSLDIPRLERQLAKLGDTIYTLNHAELTGEGGLTLSAGSINAMRRAAAEQLDAARIRDNTPVHALARQEYLTPRPVQTGEWQLHIHAREAGQLEQLPPEAYALAGLSLDQWRPDSPVPMAKRLLIPPRLITDEPGLAARLETLYHAGYRHLLCSNPAHVALGRQLGFTLHGDFGLHTANSAAATVYAEQGLSDLILSVELKLGAMRQLRSPVPVGAILYGRLPLMLMRNCPIRNEIGCKRCRHNLTDRTGRSFPVYCTEEYAELFNAEPIYLADRLEDWRRMRFGVLLFTDESPEQAARITQQYRTGQAVLPAHYTRGLAYRGVQ